MVRSLAEPFLWFMVPFGFYVGYLVAQFINPFDIGRWTRRVVIPLMVAGTAFAVGSLVVYGLFAERHEGGYRPAHIENGRIVPGEMR